MSKPEKTCFLFPAHLKIQGEKCVVIGGGQIALRKVRLLAGCGADIIVISPILCTALKVKKKKGIIKNINRQYKDGDLTGAFMAIIASDNSEINKLAAVEACNKQILINCVDNPVRSSLYVPAFLRRGNVTISISTSGQSPALARKIKNKLEKEFGQEYIILAILIGEIRREIKNSGFRASRTAWQKSISLKRLCKMVKDGKYVGAKNLITSNLYKYNKQP